MPPKTNYFPIISEIDIELTITQPEPKRNYKDVDWGKLREDLKELLWFSLHDDSIIETQENFFKNLSRIENAILQIP